MYSDIHFVQIWQMLGQKPKSLEFVMGLGDIRTTMNVYTHARYDTVEASIDKILRFTTPNAETKVDKNA